MKVTSIAMGLNENADNRYKLTYEIAEIAKKLVEESNPVKDHDDLLYSAQIEKMPIQSTVKPVIQAIMMKASEGDFGDNELIG